MRIDAAGLRRAALCCVAIVLVTGGCRRDRAIEPDDGAAAQPEQAPGERATAGSAKPQAGPLSPASIETLAGLWRVAAIDGPGYSLRDARAVGSLLEIRGEQMAWSYRPDGDFPASDLCEEPYAGPVESDAAAPLLRPRFAAALARLDPGATLDEIPYEFDCLGGGRWGPGEIGTAHFYRLGEGAFLMSWYGDTILLLRRFREAGDATPSRERAPRADDFTE